MTAEDDKSGQAALRSYGTDAPFDLAAMREIPAIDWHSSPTRTRRPGEKHLSPLMQTRDDRFSRLLTSYYNEATYISGTASQ